MRVRAKALRGKSEKARLLYLQAWFVLDLTESLCRVMEREGVTQVELARRCGVSQAAVSQALSGSIGIRFAVKLAEALGYGIDHKFYRLARRRTRG